MQLVNKATFVELGTVQLVPGVQELALSGLQINCEGLLVTDKPAAKIITKEAK